MMFKARNTVLMAAAAGACLTTVALGQSLTTAPSNNGSGGVYMDLTALNQNLRVTQFDVEYTGTIGSPVDVEIWIRSGSYVGFESDPSAWTLHETVPGIRQGTAVPSPLMLSEPIELPVGEVTGVYLHCITTGGGIRYNGTGAAPPTTFWSNADISLSGDIARIGDIPFSGSIFTPRTFSGTVYYEPSGPADPFDIRMSASVDNDRIALDENATITYLVRNPSEENVTGVTVTVDIPTGMSYVSDDRGGSVSAGTFTASLGNLNAGDDTTLNLTLKGDAADLYTITGEAAANEPDPNPGNNSASVEIRVIDATLRVLLTGAADISGTAGFVDTQNKLLDTGEFIAVDAHDASTGGTLPTLAQLQQYDAVMVWSNGTYISDFDLGNLLADYVDAGGAVVCAVFETSTTTIGRSLLGRWADENYWIIQQRSGNLSSFASLGTINDPTHPTVQGVSSLTASTAFRPSTTMLVPGGQTIATWDDGIPLIAVNDAMPGRVDLGMHPPSSDTGGGWWQVGTDGAVIMANALKYAASGGAPTCRPDLNGDGVVDADDFFLFLQFFAAGDLRADFNNDGIIDADDFFIFLNEFAAGC
ncbi:MAG: DUF11 domain-containing protein [Phycisphaerales bacterium]|nr:MAG: DUF11 domain-containing protein [Phycisphaerales bacterium]